MGTERIENVEVGEMAAQFGKGTDNYYEIPPATSDLATGSKENEYINDKYSDYLGFYNKIPELASAIDVKATWTVGRGFQSDPETELLLDTIKGNGIDTFNTILENMIRTYNIGGDAFCEIIRDDEGILINLKVLDPETIKIISNKKGMIIRYEQFKKLEDGTKKTIWKVEPEDMFHLARNRISTEVHGKSVITRLENIIKYRNQAMADWDRVLHRNIDPIMIYHLETDDPAEVATIKRKMDLARGKGENLYVPKGAVVPEQSSVAPNSNLNPITWIRELNQYFFQAVGVPQIILGNSGEFTEATAKIAYLSFQQMIQEEQLYIEEQVLAQLNLYIELEFPASLENELLSDTKKDGELKAAIPSDTTAGAGQ